MNNISNLKFNVLLHSLLAEMESVKNLEMNEYRNTLKTREFVQEKNIKIITDIFPTMTDDEIKSVLMLFKLYDEHISNNQIEFVATIPEDVNVPVRQTIGVIRQILCKAKKHILITGFAISNYFDDIFEILKEKSNQGVHIEFYIDNNFNITNKLNTLTKSLNTNNLLIYKYIEKEKHSSLHAKTIVVDYKTAFVSSANLSYNGIMNNIELGVLITGDKAKTINDLFFDLKKTQFTLI